MSFSAVADRLPVVRSVHPPGISGVAIGPSGGVPWALGNLSPDSWNEGRIAYPSSRYLYVWANGYVFLTAFVLAAPRFFLRAFGFVRRLFTFSKPGPGMTDALMPCGLALAPSMAIPKSSDISASSDAITRLLR